MTVLCSVITFGTIFTCVDIYTYDCTIVLLPVF